MTNVANANEANVSVAVANTNSAETLPKQTDSSPVMIKADRLIEEYQADPKKTYEKYRGRTMSVTGKLKEVFGLAGGSNFGIVLQTGDNGKTELKCSTEVDSKTADIYIKMKAKLKALKEAGQIQNAPSVTVTGLYADSDSEPKVTDFKLVPCNLTGFAK